MTHMYVYLFIYIYIYICVCVCIYACICVGRHRQRHSRSQSPRRGPSFLSIYLSICLSICLCIRTYTYILCVYTIYVKMLRPSRVFACTPALHCGHLYLNKVAAPQASGCFRQATQRPGGFSLSESLQLTPHLRAGLVWRLYVVKARRRAAEHMNFPQSSD